VTNDTTGVNKAGFNVFGLQPGIALKQGLLGITRGKHAQDVLNSKSTPTNNRLTPKDLRVHRDALEKSLLIHR
jgi:hypothetical protein